MINLIQRSCSWLTLAAILLSLMPAAATAAGPEATTCALEYTSQAGDQLRALAARYLGNSDAYPAIWVATRLKLTEDKSFADIADPERVAPGSKLCIPQSDETPALLNTVVDALGRATYFEQSPRRVAIAGKASFLLADALYTFPQARERVITMPQGGQAASGFLSVLDDEYAQKSFLETDAGPEQIAATRPDVVILKSYMAEKLGAPLEQLGIPVVYLDLETPEQYMRDLTALGQLFGDTVRAEVVRAFYRERLERVVQIASRSNTAKKPRVLLVQYTEKGGRVAFSVPPAVWIQTRLVEIAGAVPVWAEAVQGGGWTVVNMEQIAAWNPDIIAVIAYTADPGQVVQQLEADSQWQLLSAVQNGQLYAFPKDYNSWDQPDTRWILGLIWLARLVHPEHFAELDVRQEMAQFYHDLYGIDRTTLEMTVLPRLQGDLR